MWFTLTGRLHTRLVSLAGPLALTVVAATVTGDSDYWLLFALMAILGLVLEMGVYGWSIGYQPRWLTIGLGAVEFLLLKWIVEWPYPFEIRLHTKQALVFYVAAWLLMWFTSQALLPILWPRWMEDGGEFRPALPNEQLHPHEPRFGDPPYRRMAYVSSMGTLIFVSLPWLTALIRTPSGHRFIGLLWLDGLHLHALADVVAGSTAPMKSVGHIIGYMARLGWWPVLVTYQVAWLVISFIWLLGVFTVLQRNRRRPLQIAGLGSLPIMVLPSTWLCSMAAVLWLILSVSRWRPRFGATANRLVWTLALCAVVIWTLSWLRISTAPYVYVREDIWQMLTWLEQSPPSSMVINAPQDLSDLVRSLSGQPVAVSAGEQAVYWIGTGQQCAMVSPILAHGQVCLVP